ncbi:MAG TPA: NAD+ synthase [Firmicutes bacterium]|jgi:NAD+ synthase (glutamine-hydrolysing)|nr:NAD+ synthase [Bacillota bacterium]
MKVTIAQLNPVVGDIAGNLGKVKTVLAQCSTEKADLVVFPELFLVGYPPKDLLERSWFIQKVDQAMNTLVQISLEYPETGLVIGAPLPTGRDTGKSLANCAVLIYQGEILFAQQKSLLPTYDVFDEARYFEPAIETQVIQFKGETLGISICEDAWNDPDFWPQQLLYDEDPIRKLADQGATLLINISASPFHFGKDELRYNLIRNHARKHKIPFVFVNQIGGNDDLIFDGGSMCFDGEGNPIFVAPFFKEHLQTVDMSISGATIPYRPFEKIDAVYQALVLGLGDYLRKCGFKGAVVGLSGGIDSALTATLAVAAMGKENVLGITMPSQFSSGGSVADSKQLAENLGIPFEIIAIAPIYQAYLQSLTQHFEGKEADTTEENIQARIRGNILMAFSNKFGYLLLSTGNKSELAVGYCTLYGDMSGGLSTISDVPKTMVYELAEYVNRQKEIIPKNTIQKAPSAELRPDQTDQDTLPPYPVLDKILAYYIEEGYSVDEIVELGMERETVQWVVRTVDRNEYKRKQAAPGLKVTSKAFGVGRRMPVAKKLEY